jgi:hypothetical protein
MQKPTMTDVLFVLRERQGSGGFVATCYIVDLMMRGQEVAGAEAARRLNRSLGNKVRNRLGWALSDGLVQRLGTGYGMYGWKWRLTDKGQKHLADRDRARGSE